MKILVFSWRDPKHPLAGGAEQVMHEHMKGWINEGHSVTLFASYFKGCSHKETLDGVELIRHGNQLLGVQTAAFFWYIFGKHPKFDLVIDEFHGTPFFTPLYVYTKKLAVIQEVAREVWFLNHLPKPINWIVGLIGYITEPLFFIFYKNIHFMVGSQSAKDDLIKMGIGKNNITIVPHGVILESRKRTSKKEKIPTLIFLGALTKDKGIEDVIKTFSLIDKDGRYNFWIIGKGSIEYTKFLKNLVKKAKFRNKVTFFGFVDKKTKFRLLSRAWVLINPSRREGWGLVNIEANSVQTPVVGYNAPGLVDSVKNGVNGILCAENSPKELYLQIKTIVNDKDKYKELQKGAYAWSQKFNWAESKNQSLKLIRKITKPN